MNVEVKDGQMVIYLRKVAAFAYFGANFFGHKFWHLRVMPCKRTFIHYING